MWLLSHMHPLNETTVTLKDRPAVYENRIDALSLFYKKQFIHVSVPWGDFPLTGPCLVNLLALQIFNAGRFATRDRKCRVIIYMDEAQCCITEQLIKQYAQARAHGITYVLIHQQREQLADVGGKDLRALIDTNTAWSIDFDVSSKEMIQWVQDHSPTAVRMHASLSCSSEEIGDLKNLDEARLELARQLADKFTLTEHEGPLYSAGDILRLNSTGKVAWLRVGVPRDNLRTVGVVPFYWDHHVTLEQYHTLLHTPRPGSGPGTITVSKEPFAEPPKPTNLKSPIVPKPQNGG
jgi:hypothetical protein